MCGYCIEASMALGLLESEILATDFVLEGGWTSVYLQETKGLIQMLERTKASSGFPGSLDVALCRLFEMYISRGFQPSIFDAIVSVYNPDDAVKFFDGRSHRSVESLASPIRLDFWSRLWIQDTYRDQSSWEAFTKDTDELLKESESLLENYCNWWILGKRKTASDPSRRLEETGLMDPIDDTPESEWSKFYDLFPAIYFALSVVRRYRSKSDVIGFIALCPPKDTPDFFGYDLWLQRQAFLVCVSQYGVPFIGKHLQDIRLELIAYAVLKLEMTDGEYALIKDLVSTYRYGVVAMDRESVTQLIDDLQAYKASGHKAPSQ